MDREQLTEYIREVLAHLYDQAFLATHLLRTVWGAENEPISVDVLQQVFIESIEQLKPSRDSPQYLPRWRRYRHLCLRYLEGADPPCIAEQLSIGERQVRRDHKDAVDALASILWGRYSRLRWAEGGQAADVSTSTYSNGIALELEVRRIASAPVREAVATRAILDGVLATVRHLAASRGVALDISLPEHLPPVKVDRVVLRQILVNVLVYAISQAGGERVVLSQREAKQQLQLRVAIHGKTRVSSDSVERGQQEQVSPTALAASRRLVELQGGAFQQRTEGPSSEEICISLPCLSLVTVLVIDDNPDFVRLFQRYLGSSPYRIVQAGVATEALDLTREVQPDLITLDVMMPSQDGWEILQALKEDPETRHIPVLVCTVLNEPSLALSLGADAFLAKPVTRQALLEAVDRCAGLTPSRAHRDSPPSSALPLPLRGR